MKVLVTGASGFIGSHIVSHLLARGDAVRALYRRSDIPESLKELQRQYGDRLELLRFDLSFPNSLPDFKSPSLLKWRAEAKEGIPSQAWEYQLKEPDLEAARLLLRGCDRVVHAAAVASDWGSFEQFFSANTHPTRILTAAAEKNRIERFVFVSSLAVQGFGPHRFSTELGPYYRPVNPYQTSKRLSESLVSTVAGRGLSVMTIRPGNVYGPNDTTSFFPIFDAMVKGQMGTIDRGRSLTCPVYVDDLCRAILGALDFDGDVEAGDNVFNITDGKAYTWRELVEVAAEAIDVPAPRLNVSSKLARPAAIVLECLFFITARKNAPPLTRYRVDQLRDDYSFSTAHAEDLLGYKAQMGLNEGMDLCARSWRRSRFKTG